MTKKHLFLLSMAAMLFTSCCTIVKGTKAKVTVRNDAVTKPVTLFYDGNIETDVYLPHEIKIKKGKKPTIITAEAQGYEKAHVNVYKKFDAMAIGNIVFGGIIGLAVDAGNGAWMKPRVKEITIPFKPILPTQTVYTPVNNVSSAYSEKLDKKVNGDVVVSTPKVNGITPGTSDIDFNIPATGASRENTFCVIIANEIYKQDDTPNVKYAAQDGKTFQDYCLRTLGIPNENIRFIPNASYVQMKNTFEWLHLVGDVYGKDAKFIVYYAGHGIPDENGNSRLIPADVSINDMNSGFGLKDLYSSLGKISTSSVLVLIDACFSGNDRDDVAALDGVNRGIVREIKKENIAGNIVVLTAASGSETALSYDEKAHGLFSYYLMKKLQETKGNVTYGELYDYVKKEVLRKSIVAKGKKQTPSVTYSSKITNWKNIKF